jgi:hypothetical protein
MIPRTRAPKREIFGWAMFDFANQAYTLLIITVVFGDLFTRVIVGNDGDYRLGNFLWSLALSTSYLLVVVCSPIAGAIMDYTASKKRFLFASYLLTVVATAALYFVAPGYALLGVLLLIVSNFGYSIGEAFIASFLPDLGPPEDLGKISGFGWALGLHRRDGLGRVRAAGARRGQRRELRAHPLGGPLGGGVLPVRRDPDLRLGARARQAAATAARHRLRGHRGEARARHAAPPRAAPGPRRAAGLHVLRHERHLHHHHLRLHLRRAGGGLGPRRPHPHVRHRADHGRRRRPRLRLHPGPARREAHLPDHAGDVDGRDRADLPHPRARGMAVGRHSAAPWRPSTCSWSSAAWRG